jgi:16S rRNA (cytosine967-C5)-methyltransferase
MVDLPRQLAFQTLQAIAQGAYADIALDRTLTKVELERDRRFITELIYGTVRRQRTLDHLITQLARRPAAEQPPKLRLVLQLGLYQLHYLPEIPAAATLHTSVELAKHLKLGGLAKVVNGILRQYQRLAATGDPLQLPEQAIAQLGIAHSYPDWIIETWYGQLGAETQTLCEALNQTPSLDLRINPLRTSREQVQVDLETQGVNSIPIPGLPQALRLTSPPGLLTKLPGFEQGHWMVQEASAQLVGHLLNPQPGWTVLDLCAAPGGKTLHLAELMAGKGTLWACDRTESRLRRLQQNLDRMKVNWVQCWQGDSRQLPETMPKADAILLDAPCSGLGTLHRHADARWRQTPKSVKELASLQLELLQAAAAHTNPRACLVYATCTLHPQENQRVIDAFLKQNADWVIAPVDLPKAFSSALTPEGAIQIWPHRQGMDGFFMTQLRRS